MLPISVRVPGSVKYIDALYTSTSAVCVTGLLVIDVYDNFTTFGQVVVMLLIQIGGLGITTLGAGLILAIKRRVNIKERNIIQETLNLDDAKDLLKLFKKVFKYTFIIELIGAAFSIISFSKNYQIGEAIWKSVFHSVASFNNSGFDILGGGLNLQNYKADVLLNIVTIILIILGGIGFLVISDVITNKGRFKKFTLQSKIVLLTNTILLVVGMLAIKLAERGNITWLGALFTSTSARTAGFSTFHLGKFSTAGLLVVIVLMFIGASPGSTGGGIKTTTLFVLFMGVRSMISHKSTNAFKYEIPRETVRKAMVITILALCIVILGTFVVCLIEPNIKFIDVLFETVSAYGTVGLSTGITGGLTIASKIIFIIIMYMGRVGPLTVISLWYTGEDEVFKYAEGIVPVG